MAYYIPPPGASGTILAKGVFWVGDRALVSYQGNGSPYNQYLYIAEWVEAGGGVVSQGVNSNGYYATFSTGLQVCWFTATDASPSWSLGGSGDYYANTTGTLPATFASAPTVIGSNGDGQIAARTSWLVKSEATSASAWRVWWGSRTNSSTASISAGCIAIGMTA